jgi:acyl carrier protein
VCSRDKTQEKQNVTQPTKRLTIAQNVHKRVVKILSEQLGVREHDILLESTMDDHGGDSLDGVEIIMAIEEEFESEITDSEMEKIKTTRQIVALLLPKIIDGCSFNDAHNVAEQLKDAKAGKKPAAKKMPVPVAEEEPQKSRTRHLDDLFEYTISESAMMEFAKSFNTVFSTAPIAYLHAYKTKEDSDAWRIQMTTRLSGEAIDGIARFVEKAGFAFVKSTEHMVHLHGSANFGIVTAIHFSLITHGL